MDLAKAIAETQAEEELEYKKYLEKCGDYTGDNCPNCGRERVMLGKDKKRRCEKCSWCIEDNDYDGDFRKYL